MDTFFRRLTSTVAVVLLALFSTVSHAQDSSPMCGDRSGALSRVQAWMADNPGWNLWTGPVVHSCNSNDVCSWTGSYGVIGSGTPIPMQNWMCPDLVPPKNPCDGMKSSTQNYAGKVLNGMKTCMDNPQPDGSSVSCGVVFHAISDPVRNQWGNWNTYGTLAPTGDVCGAGNGDGGGWTSGDGSPPAEPPPAPPKAPPPPKDPPKKCGNISCYDPKSGEYCAQSDGGPVCTKGPPPNPNGGPPQDGGACGSKGDATACAGKPQAPPPPNDKVPDPPTATNGSDDYTHADANTGNVYHTSVTVYHNGAGGVSNGAAPGDSKPPASSSSSGGPPQSGEGDDKGDDKTGASGGGDCANPPFVEGSAAMGMIAMQAWHTRCDVSKGVAESNEHLKDIAKSLKPDAPTDTAPKPSVNDAWANGNAGSSDAPVSGDGIADNANKGVYNMAGMGFSSQCPMKDLEVPLIFDAKLHVPFSLGCPIGEWIRAIVIAFALFYAARITAGGNG